MNYSIRRQALLWTVAATVLLADQIAKAAIVRNMPVGMPWNPVPFLRPFVNITYVVNSGAAFGMLPNQGLFFTVVAIVVAAAILYYGRRIPDHQWWLSVSLGMQLGGALGNLTDRLHYGYVIDFVEVRHWPVFNLADSAIVVGVIILAYHLWREEESSESTSQAEMTDTLVATIEQPPTAVSPTINQNDGS